MLLIVWSQLANDSNVRVIAADSLHNVIVVYCKGAAFAGLLDDYYVVVTGGIVGKATGFCG